MYEEVQQAAAVICKRAMPYETNPPLHLCASSPEGAT